MITNDPHISNGLLVTDLLGQTVDVEPRPGFYPTAPSCRALIRAVVVGRHGFELLLEGSDGTLYDVNIATVIARIVKLP